MKKSKIECYEETIKYFMGAYNNSQDSFMKEEAQSIVKSYVSKLIKVDFSKKDNYVSMLEKVGLSETDLGELEISEDLKKVLDTENEVSEINEESQVSGFEEQKDKKYEDAKAYVDKHILSSTDEEMCKEFENLLEQLEEDMKNSNDKLIETWVNNYKDFVIKYGLDEQIMFDYMENLFINVYKYDISNLEELYETIREKAKIAEEKEDKKDNIETTVEENKLDEDKTIEEVTKNEKSELNSDELTKETEEKDSTKVEGLVSEEKPKEDKTVVKAEPLKIINKKKSIGTKTHLLSAIGMLLIGSTFSLGFLGYIITYATSAFGINFVSNLIKKNKIRKVLEENNVEIKFDEDKQTGVIIDKATGEEMNVDIDKERYENIKNSLIKLKAIESTEKSVIPEKNKQNGLLKRLKNVGGNILNKFKDISAENALNRYEEAEILEEVEEKGRRL